MKKTLMAIALFLLSGCDEVISVKNGIVPDLLLGEASKFEGTYVGQFEGKPGTLELKIVDKKALVAFKGDDGSLDILRPECRSVISDLQTIGLDSKKKTLLWTAFEFYPVRCHREVRGQQLLLFFKTVNDKVVIDARILEYTETIGGNHGPCGPDGEGCTTFPPATEIDHYLRGQFVRAD